MSVVQSSQQVSASNAASAAIQAASTSQTQQTTPTAPRLSIQHQQKDGNIVTKYEDYKGRLLPEAPLKAQHAEHDIGRPLREQGPCSNCGTKVAMGWRPVDGVPFCDRCGKAERSTRAAGATAQEEAQPARDDIRTPQERIDALEQQLAALSGEILGLRNENYQLRDENHQLRDENHQLRARLDYAYAPEVGQYPELNGRLYNI